MKKLAALAVLAAVSASSYAQSSVTLFGVVDATVQLGHGSKANKTALGNGGNSSSRFGVRGTEDLGGGLSAGFWLEAGMNNDDGTGKNNNFNGGNITNNQFGSVSSVSDGLKFARRSTVSLSSSQFGEVRLGRDFSAQYLNISVYDPFGDVGVGATMLDSALGLGGPVTVRVSNAASYFSPSFGGVYGQLQAYTGENTITVAGTPTTTAVGKKDGQGYGGRIGYKAGPIDVALATSETKYLAVGNIATTNIGGSYDFGVARLMGTYSQDKVKAPTNAKGKGYLVGVAVPLGQGEIRASYSSYKRELGVEPEANKIALGYVYSLSKRTAIYSTYAHVKNKNGAGIALNGGVLNTASDNSSGLDIGLRHSF